MLDYALSLMIYSMIGIIVSVSIMAILAAAISVGAILAVIVWSAMSALEGYMRLVYEPVLRGYKIAFHSTVRILTHGWG